MALDGTRATAGTMTSIHVEMPGEFTYAVRRLEQPERIVVDLRGAGLTMSAGQMRRPLLVNDARVKQVRAGSSEPGTARLVLDLEPGGASQPYSVMRQGGAGRLRIEVGRASGERTPPTTAAATREAGPRLAETTARVAFFGLLEPAHFPGDANSLFRPQTIPPDTASATQAVTEAPAESTTQAAVADPPAQAAPPVAPRSLPARTGIVREATLTLHEAVAMALESNPNIKAWRVEGEQARFRWRAARGVFDPLLSASTSFQKQVLPVSNSLGGSNTGAVLSRSWQTTPALSGLLPKLGASYEVSFSSQRFSTNNLFATLNPNYPTALTFQYVQPLWRGLRYDSRRHTIEVEKKNQEMSVQTFQRQVMELLAQTEQAYWEVSFARRELAVQDEAREIARRQAETNRRQVEKGQLAAIEQVAAQAQLANFDAGVFAAQELLTRAENRLKALILPDRQAPLWDAALLTEDPPQSPAAAPPPLKEAVQEALSERPEIGEMRIAMDLNRAQQRLQSEELKPRVDLVGRYTRTGLAGTAVAAGGGNPLGDSLTPALIRLNQLSALAGLAPVGLGAVAPIPAPLIGSYGQSLRGMFGGDYPTSLVELRVALPVGNRTAQANLGLALAESRRLGYQQRQVEQVIEEQVRNAIQSMDSAGERLAAARTKFLAAEEQFHSEERRFEKGLTTLFLVQQRQLTMVTSKTQVHRAETDLGVALAAFDLARAAIHKRHNVQLR